MADPAPQSGIDVGELERELTTLWASLGEEDPQGGVTRSCVLNLVIYTPAKEATFHLDETLIEVTSHHPSRAIVLVEDRGAEAPLLGSWVTSRCALSSGASRQLCCEQVTIKASSARVKETPSAIASLILADLPVFLWWRDVPKLHGQVFEKCASLADRVLVDSAMADSLESCFGEIAAFLGRKHKRLSLMDLNWARLLTWRSTIAAFYDVSDYIPALENLRTVAITFHEGDGPHAAARALYLSAWLATRLGWKLKAEGGGSRDGDNFRFVFVAAQGEIEVTLKAVGGQRDQLGHIDEVILTTRDTSSSNSVFSVRRTTDGMRLTTGVTLDGTQRPDRVMGYDRWTDSALLSRELEHIVRDRVFEQAALLANEMTSAGG